MLTMSKDRPMSELGFSEATSAEIHAIRYLGKRPDLSTAEALQSFFSSYSRLDILNCSRTIRSRHLNEIEEKLNEAGFPVTRTTPL